MIEQICLYFGDVKPFLSENDDISPATEGKLLGFFSDVNKKAILEIELAAIVD